MSKSLRFYLKILFIWIAGFFIALGLFCLLCLVCHNSMEPDAYVAEVDRLIPQPGLTHRHRNEGWGTTKYGKLGVYGIEDIQQVVGDKIILWGDSYVEALEVNDPNKTTMQFNKMWKSKNDIPLTCAGIGASGTHLADYVHYAPIYEKVIPEIKAHVVFLHSDMVGFKEGKVGGSIKFDGDKVAYSFVPPNKNISQRKSELVKVLRFFGLDFIWWIYNDIRTYTWRFRLGQAGVTDIPVLKQYKLPHQMKDAKWHQDGYDFLIRKFKDCTDKEIVFIYAPHVPYIFDNKIYDKDRSAELIKKITESCRKNGITFINMEKPFREYYQKTGKSPRGFPNSRPFMGHLNPEGHRLIAEKMIEHFSRKK